MFTSPMVTLRPRAPLTLRARRARNRFAFTNGGTTMARTSTSARPPMNFLLRLSCSGIGASVQQSSADKVQRPAPKSLVKEVQSHMAEPLDPFRHGILLVLMLVGLKGPVDEHRSSDHVLSRDKSPIAAVPAHVAVVSHTEITVRRDCDLAV